MVAAVAGAVGVVVGVVAAVTVASADDPARDVDTSVDRSVRCDEVITDDVLSALAWSDPGARAEERVGRCEWFGAPGSVTAGTLGSAVSEVCADASGRDGYEASTAWLELTSVADGCVVAGEDGVGVYEAIAQVGSDLVQVRIALLEPRPVEDIRAALVTLVDQTAAASE